MTPPRGPRRLAAMRLPPLPLLLVYLVPLVVAAVTPVSDFNGPQGDLTRYHGISSVILLGAVPYADFPLEYPPLALVPMVLPVILWPFGLPNVPTYAWLFAGLQAVLLAATGLVLARIVALGGTRGPGWPADAASVQAQQRVVAWRLVMLVAGAGLAITWRFDLFPTLLLLVGLWAGLEQRPVVAGAAIGAGILAKLFPIVVAPAIALLWLAPLDRPRLLRFGQSLVATGFVGMLPFVALAGVGAFSFIGYQADRGLQIESVGGGLVMLFGLLTGEPNRLISPFSAWEVTGTPARVLLVLGSAALLAGFAGLGWLGWRRARAEAAGAGVLPGTIVQLATAAVLVLVLTSKVFSIQYVVWIVPFAALLPWRQFWLAAAAVALTIPIHPVLYEALVRQEALPILVLNLRNALLTALLAWLFWDLARPARLELTTFRSAT